MSHFGLFIFFFIIIIIIILCDSEFVIEYVLSVRIL